MGADLYWLTVPAGHRWHGVLPFEVAELASLGFRACRLLDTGEWALGAPEEGAVNAALALPAPPLSLVLQESLEHGPDLEVRCLHAYLGARGHVHTVTVSLPSALPDLAALALRWGKLLPGGWLPTGGGRLVHVFCGDRSFLVTREVGRWVMENLRSSPARPI